MGFGVVDFLVPGLDIPLPPGSDDLHIGSKPLDGQLKPNLVVALAGGAVGNGVGTFSQSDFCQLLADDRPGEGGAQQVSFILSAHLHGRNDDLVHHFVHQIGNDQLAGTGGDGLSFQTFQLVSLTDVAGHGDDFGIVVVLLQPGDDNGCIQSAGVGQNNLFDVFLACHKTQPPDE